MSHVVDIDLEVKNLPALKADCKRLGFEFHDNQTSFMWYGRWVGDTTLPKGFLSPPDDYWYTTDCGLGTAVATNTCIYCQKPVDLRRGQGDHVIPAALGRFEDDLRFRRICRTCNRAIGKCEDQLLRCGTGGVPTSHCPAGCEARESWHKLGWR